MRGKNSARILEALGKFNENHYQMGFFKEQSNSKNYIPVTTFLTVKMYFSIQLQCQKFCRRRGREN
jgi:hypothetical protein